jgi:hypothetical protein
MSSKNIPTKQATSGNNSSVLCVLFDAFCNVLKSASSRSVSYYEYWFLNGVESDPESLHHRVLAATHRGA